MGKIKKNAVAMFAVLMAVIFASFVSNAYASDCDLDAKQVNEPLTLLQDKIILAWVYEPYCYPDKEKAMTAAVAGCERYWGRSCKLNTCYQSTYTSYQWCCKAETIE